MPVSKPSKYQKQIARLLGINISKDSWRVAAAKIHDIVDVAINPRVRDNSPTEAQIELAEQIGLDISKDTYRIGFARIADKLDELNEEALSRMQLKAGDKVIFTEHLSLDEESLPYLVQTVSSIGRNGKVYFKGTTNNGQAWPAQLSKVESIDALLNRSK
ncbi:MAG TPA: hypothetical protein VE732_03830 [Nitrososphaera sp.]|jgi:hypothetical protein|nr:hypothetical protein [Nitrososphaera sp.]